MCISYRNRIKSFRKTRFRSYPLEKELDPNNKKESISTPLLVVVKANDIGTRNIMSDSLKNAFGGFEGVVQVRLRKITFKM